MPLLARRANGHVERPVSVFRVLRLRSAGPVAAGLAEVRAVSKVSFTTVLAVVLMAGLVFLAFKPEVGRQAVNWIRSQFRGGDAPQVTPVGYIPITPGR
jgi:hypothetical protein